MKITLVDPEGSEFFPIITYLGVEDRARVREAFLWAREMHGDQIRKSGELFFMHPLTVAAYLAEYEADAPTLIGALLHDVAEDTKVSIAEIKARFGEEVAKLVDGVTKFDRLTGEAKHGRELTNEELKNATHFKLFETMGSDFRIGIIKIFDRLHNMRTMGFMPPDRQQEKASETMAIYAPLAYRLGMWRIKSELQELAIAILDPARYEQMREALANYETMQKSVFDHVAQELRRKITDLGPIEIKPDLPDIFGTYVDGTDSTQQTKIFNDVPRIIILVKEVAFCYLALGQIHNLWKPLPKQFDDYIASPRENLYQSLHTAVMYNGRLLKIRIRTVDMQIASQSGVLSKWMDNERFAIWSPAASAQMDSTIQDISHIIQTHGWEMVEGVNSIVQDVLPPDKITAYTPHGDKRELVMGSTPLDFAYTIHTDVGDSCRGARVNGQEVPLTYILQDGDLVEIVRYGTEPQRIWLDEFLGYLRTNGAKAAVRRWLGNETAAVPEGRRLLQEELNLLGLPDYDHELAAKLHGDGVLENMYKALGRGSTLASTLAIRILNQTWIDHLSTDAIGQMVKTPTGEVFVIENLGQRHAKFCRTCSPQPGHDIIGFIRHDNRVTIHTIACPYAQQDEGARTLKLRWGSKNPQPRRSFFVQVQVNDRDGLLSEISDLLKNEQINIPSICAQPSASKKLIIIRMQLEVSSPRQMVRVLHRIKALSNVVDVCCLNLSPTDWQKIKANQSKFCPFHDLDSASCTFYTGK